MRFNAFLISAAAIALTGCGKKTETPQTNGNVPATTDNSVVAPVDGGAGPAGGAAPAGTTAAVETEAEKETKKKAEKEAEKEAKKKAEKEAAEKAKAEKKAARAKLPMKKRLDLAKKDVAEAKAKMAEEREALEKKLAEKKPEEKKKALAKFDEESAATVEALEREFEEIKVAEQQDKLERAYVRPELKRFMSTNNSEIANIEHLINLIRRTMVLNTENADLFNKTVEKLDKAVKAAQKAAAEREAKAMRAARGTAFARVGEKFVTVPVTVREEIKATLVKIYDESTFRPMSPAVAASDELPEEIEAEAFDGRTEALLAEMRAKIARRH